MQNQKEQTVEELIKCLREGETEDCLAAIKALGRLGDPAAIAPLSELLNNAEPRVRIRVVMALGQMADARAVEPLSRVLTGDEIPDVRNRAARALGEIAAPSAIEALGQALRDENAEVRRRAVQALNRISDARALEPLMNALSDPDRDVRRWAARGLGKIGNPAALEPLRQLRADPNVVVQNEAAQAIRAIQDRQRLEDQRSKVEKLRQERRQTNLADTIAQVRLDSQIDLEQLAMYRLEASLAADEVPPPSSEEGTDQDRERRSIVYKLQRLIRELESLGTSVHAPQLLEAWETQLQEAKGLLAVWTDSGEEHDLEEMRAELQRLRHRKEKRFNDQNRELIEMTRFVQDGYSSHLQIVQIRDTLQDPRNRRMVESWLHEAEASHNLLKATRDQGDHALAKEHHSILVKLRDCAEEIQGKESRAKSRAAGLVVLFLILGTAALVSILCVPNWENVTHDAIPVLGVPYAVVLWSAIGSVAAMLYQFLNRPVSQLETSKWLVVRPMQGIIMGSFLYLLIAAGLLIFGEPPSATRGLENAVRDELAPVVAFLGGFSDRFTKEMVKRATSILTRESSEQQEAPP